MKRINLVYLLIVSAFIIIVGCNKNIESELGNEYLLTFEEVQSLIRTINKSELEQRENSISIVNLDTIFDKYDLPAILIIKYLENNEHKFALISNDTRTIHLIGHGNNEFTCKYNLKNENDTSPEVDYWIDAQLSLIEYVRTENISKEEFETNIVRVKDDLEGVNPDFPCEDGWTRCGPVFSHTWGQGCVYNNSCPEMACNIWPCGSRNAWVGCVATAMVTIMKYHEHPNQYNWSTMLDIYNGFDFGMPGAEELADVMALAGQSVGMQYACWGSGITLAQARTRIIDAFRNTFGYSNPGLWYDGDTWGWTNIDSYIYDEVCISYSRPVLMIGFNQNGGHAWVCNGVERRWSCRNGRRIQWYLNYMDWGWNGAFNGWFAGWGLFPERPACIMRIWN